MTLQRRSRSAARTWSRRATTSFEPPAEKGTMSVTGRLGNVCDHVVPESAKVAKPTPANCRRRRRCIVICVFPLYPTAAAGMRLYIEPHTLPPRNEYVLKDRA